jgi:hypothetical protein
VQSTSAAFFPFLLHGRGRTLGILGLRRIARIPLGPIYTVQSLWVNLCGGHDVTPEAATALRLPIDKSTLYPEEGSAAGA